MKTVFITGATSGIGLAAAQHFSQQGHRVFISGRRAEKLDDTLTRLNAAGGQPVEGFLCDQADPEQIRSLAGRLQADGAQLDALILNAGIFLPELFTGFTTANLMQQLQTNLIGPLQTLHELLPVLANPASVVLVSSIAAEKSFAGCTAYGASKAALEGAMGSLNAELAERGIRVNCLRPGVTLTEIQAKAGMDSGALASLQQQMAATPAGRMLQPQDMVPALEYLALNGSSAVYGVRLAVDGGFCL